MNEALMADFTDLLSPELSTSPFPYFADLRSTSPVHWNAKHRVWLVTGYNDASEGFRDKRLLSNRLKPIRERLPASEQPTIGRALTILESWMVFQDEPDHRRLRGIVHKAFTPQGVARMEANVQQVVEEQTSKMLRHFAEHPDTPFDVVKDFAGIIPATVICNMLGIPPHEQDEFVHWTEELTGLLGGATIDPTRNDRAYAAVCALEEYLTGVIERTPPDAENVMASLINAENEGERLTRQEVIATGILLLFGGNKTTSCMIANGLRALLLHPEQYDMVRTDPARMPLAVEEIFRWEGHTKATVRIVGEDFAWRGAELKKGQRVFLSETAANRDPEMFPNPDVFDVTRTNAGRHVAFGTGIHLCLGQALARLQLRVTYRHLLQTLPSLSLVRPEGEWVNALLGRTQKSLLLAPSGKPTGLAYPSQIRGGHRT